MKATYTPKAEPIKAAGLKHRTIFSLSGPRPRIVKRIVQAWTALAAIGTIIVTNFSLEIPDKTEGYIIKTVLTITLILGSIGESLGVKPKE